MIHTNLNPKSSISSPICGRISRNYKVTVSREDFIKHYQENQGRGCCSRCANYLINNKYMERADATMPEDVQQIIQVLTDGTAVLREMFYEQTEAYAIKKFASISESVERPLIAWYDQYGVNHENGVLKNGEYNRKNVYRMRGARERQQRIVRTGQEAFVAQAMKDAKAHYEDSIAKLASRIQGQSMDISKLVVKTASINRNIDTVITDGVNTVRAFTILAALDSTLVRPHYRYLIK